MERWQNKIAVVTGASSGIGAAIAIDLVKAGLIVIGLARRKERIEELKRDLPVDKQSNLYAYKCDVSKLDSVNEAFDWIINKFGAVDMLVNNAGVSKYGTLCEMDPQLIQEVLQLNVMGVVYCTKRAFASMKEREFNGHIILINSISGHTAYASLGDASLIFNIYSPTKFAITAMNEIYAHEFSGLKTKIKITSISPGLVDTEVVPENIKTSMHDRILKSEDVSKAVLFAISTPPHVQIQEMIIKPVGELAL